MSMQLSESIMEWLSSWLPILHFLSPSIVITPMLKSLNDLSFNEEEVILFCQLTYPLGRPGYVEDIAKSIEFLASDNSSFITGVQIPVDGGSAVSNRSRL